MIKLFVFTLFLALAALSSASAFRRELLCNGPNEEYQCGSACQTTCATLGQPCPIVNIRCNDDCYCKDGYARDYRDICIPIKACPRRRNHKKSLTIPPFSLLPFI